MGADTKGTVFTGALARVAGEDAKSYDINQGTFTLSETGAVNYAIPAEGGFVKGTFTIHGTPINPTVTLDDWVYGNEKKPSVTGNTGKGNVTYNYKKQNENDSKYTGTKPTSVGKYTVRAQIAAKGQYEAATVTDNFNITKAMLTITADAKEKDYLDDDPALTFSVEGLKYSDTKNIAVTTCNLQRAEGEVVVDGGYAITYSGQLKTSDNYNGTFVSSALTIHPKNLGSGGTPPPGISVYVKKNNDANNPWSVSVYNGSREFQASDFTFAVEETETAGSYLVTITGKAPNSTGYATTPYTNFEFPIRISDSEKAAPYFTGEQDMKTSSDIKPYIVNKVNPSVGTISITPISYIPKGVPVLLLTNANASGLTLSPMNDDISISDVTLNNNKLMFSSDGAVQVADAQAYLYYLNSNNIGEFVLTTARTLKIIKNETTGLFKLVNDNPTENLNVRWYTLDGRRLSGKPTKKGLYIYYGRKMVVK